MAAPPKKRGFNRRTMLNVAVGTAVVAEAAVLGYNALGGGSVTDHGVHHAGADYTEAQRHNIMREVVDSRADVRGQSLGNWVALLPTKLGGGTYAIDLNSNRVLGSIWYWNYGDYSPISHHLCAFPSADPYHGFEFVNITQGGKNSLIYGIPTAIRRDRARGHQHLSRALRRHADAAHRERLGDAPGSGLACTSRSTPRTRSPTS